MEKIDRIITRFKCFQNMILDNDICQDEIYLESENLIQDLHECSKLIEDKFSDISRKLTDHMNTGRWQK